MTGGPAILWTALAGCAAAVAAADVAAPTHDGSGTGAVAVALFQDEVGDAVLRRTDSGSDGIVPFEATLPDVRSVTLRAWAPVNAASNPFVGSGVAAADAHFFRLDVEFEALLNAPGPLGTPPNYNPFRWGPSPVYGFLEIDVDPVASGSVNDEDHTGGELDPEARFRFLANAARFGQLPRGPYFDGRAARSGQDYDNNFFGPPQYERSNADFVLSLCGCFPVMRDVEAAGDGDEVFEPGEVWIMRGRFFQRAGGYRGASSANGSVPGAYDPLSLLRWAHDADADRTTLSLVFPLDHVGAALLNGEPQQPMDPLVNNHTSMTEALLDIIVGADKANLDGPTQTLVRGWAGRDPAEYVNPARWRVRALYGTTYATFEPSFLAWTDVAFGSILGDVNGDGGADSDDRALVIDYINANDGGGSDAGAAGDNAVTIPNHGPNFSLYDIDGDGVVNGDDAAFYDPPNHPADFNADGVVDGQDLALLLGSWGPNDGPTDVNEDGVVDGQDLALLLGAWGNGSTP